MKSTWIDFNARESGLHYFPVSRVADGVSLGESILVRDMDEQEQASARVVGISPTAERAYVEVDWDTLEELPVAVDPDATTTLDLLPLVVHTPWMTELTWVGRTSALAAGVAVVFGASAVGDLNVHRRPEPVVRHIDAFTLFDNGTVLV